MTTTRVLFASVSARGQINPLLTIADELGRRQSVDVYFATTDDRRTDIEALHSVSFATVGEPSRQSTLPDWDDDDYNRLTSGSKLRSYAFFLAKALDPDFLVRQYDRTIEWIDQLEPDLMVIDVNSYGAIDAARTRGIPFILNVPFPISSLYAAVLPKDYPAPFSGLPRTLSGVQRIRNSLFRLGRLWAIMRPTMVKVAMPYIKERNAAGVAAPAGMGPQYLADADAIVACSVWGIEQPFPAAPETLHMVGAVVPAGGATGPEAEEMRDWLDARESVVYIAFGTIARLRQPQIDAIVDAVSRLDPKHAVLWKVPPAQQKLLPAVLPANLRVESWVPSQIDVLAHPNVRAFFTHGGGNSAHEGLRFGKPLLVMPFWMDCYDIAARVVEAGAALPLTHRLKLDGAEIATKLDRLLTEPALAERAQHWAAKLTEAGGAAAVADLIEKRGAEVS